MCRVGNGADVGGCTSPSADSLKVVTLNRGAGQTAAGRNILNCYIKAYHLTEPFVIKLYTLRNTGVNIIP